MEASRCDEEGPRSSEVATSLTTLPEDADAGLRWRDGVGACTREAPAAPAAEGVGVVEARAAPAAEGGGVGALSPLSMLRRNETKQQQKNTWVLRSNVQPPWRARHVSAVCFHTGESQRTRSLGASQGAGPGTVLLGQQKLNCC